MYKNKTKTIIWFLMHLPSPTDILRKTRKHAPVFILQTYFDIIGHIKVKIKTHTKMMQQLPSKSACL